MKKIFLHPSYSYINILSFAEVVMFGYSNREKKMTLLYMFIDLFYPFSEDRIFFLNQIEE